MKAVGYTKGDKDGYMSDINLPIPHPIGTDILVEVKAVSVNPIDYKVRESIVPNDEEWKILGYDGTGIVKEIGNEVTMFHPGDEVWYSGNFTRQGSNQQFQLIDENIVGKKPKSLSFVEAASLPLASLFSYEMIFDRIKIPTKTINPQKTILVIGAAGGVGSVLIQLLKDLTDTIIIATAGNHESRKWLYSLGANFVINHHNSLIEELKKIDYQYVDYIVSLNKTEEHLDEILEIIAPEGDIGISDTAFKVDLHKFVSKSISICLESVFTRSTYKLEEMSKQHIILNRIAELVDKGEIRSTITQNLGLINAENVMSAFDMLKSHKTIGKIVLEGF